LQMKFRSGLNIVLFLETLDKVGHIQYV